MQLSTGVEELKGVGPVLKERLNGLGIKTVRDLIYYFPRKYEDFSQVVNIIDIKPGKVTIKGKVESATGRYVRRRLHITEAIVADETAKVRLVWFNQPYRAAQLAVGDEYFFSGEYVFSRNRYVLNNPAAEKAQNAGVSTARIVPIYRESKGVKSLQLRKIMQTVLPLITALPETLPAEVIKSNKLFNIDETLKNLHFPQSSEKLKQAMNRIAFEELIWLLMAGVLNKRQNTKLKSDKIGFKKQYAELFVRALPFTLTDAQKKTVWEILQDMQKASPMNRLVQGDVGSGKTAVAAMAAFMAARSGFQTAFMAPTETLALQHANTLQTLLQPLGLNVALLVGSTKPQARQLIKSRLASGELDILVGTHALIHNDGDFKKLGLVVVDEQHRFGVKQRSELLAKSKKMPHMLCMTATPIPRSLQLTVYGDLDISIINQLPKGRKPITTKIVTSGARHEVYSDIDEQIKLGRQAYIVCPVISEGGTNAELKSVKAEHERLNKSIFKHRRVALLHGQMKPAEKDEVMQTFKSGKADILISTTVIEVGVDVPNATVMLIEGADRFGLAQLHQLRGRVGRGEDQSFCYLIPSGERISQRLRELENSNDGFYLAEADLKLRGPGEIYGRAQHGKLDLSFVNLANTIMIKQAKEAAQWIVDNIDLLQYKQLADKVARYQRLTSLN